MKVLFYPVGQKPVTMEINGTLDEMQELVGGYIEIVRLPQIPPFGQVQFIAVVDEEGLLKGKKINRGDLAGDLFVLAIDEEEPEEFRGLEEHEIIAVEKIMDFLLPSAPIF
jgi:Domain of unknown function (DUF3846)